MIQKFTDKLKPFAPVKVAEISITLVATAKWQGLL